MFAVYAAHANLDAPLEGLRLEGEPKGKVAMTRQRADAAAPLDPLPALPIIHRTSHNPST